jgi:hypothetical protein
MTPTPKYVVHGPPDVLSGDELAQKHRDIIGEYLKDVAAQGRGNIPYDSQTLFGSRP